MAESNTLISGIDEKNREVSEVIDGSKRRFKHFLYFFSGQQISLLGSSIVSFAIIWWLTVTTQSEMMLGIASLVSLGPYIFVAPFSGMIADRFNKKVLLIGVDAFQATATVVLAVLFLTNHVSVAVIMVMLGVRGVAQAFHQPVSMSLTPIMVPKKHLSRINGIGYLVGGVINIIGPAIGVGLLAIPGINIGMVLWVDVITFCIALIPLLIIKIPSVAPKEEDESKVKESFVAQFTDGFRTLKNIKGMVSLIFLAMIFNFCMSPLFGLLPLFVNKIHGGTEANYALVVGMLQAAIVVGGLVMSLFKGFKRPIFFFIISAFIQVVFQIALTFVPNNFDGRFWTIGALLFVYVLPISIIDVSFMTSIQVLVPKEKFGRVIGTIMALTPAIRPLGIFLSGVIAEFVGINWVLIVSGVLAVISILAFYLFTPLRQLDRVIKGAIESIDEKSDESKEQIIEESDIELEMVIEEKKKLPDIPIIKSDTSQSLEGIK
ncbi:MAG: MFS transporter [Asgard group archaeon]|nr:MFS transporter [Asgard group archaeon]